MSKRRGTYLGGSTVITARPKKRKGDDKPGTQPIPFTAEEEWQNEQIKKQMLGGFGVITEAGNGSFEKKTICQQARRFDAQGIVLPSRPPTPSSSAAALLRPSNADAAS